MTWHYRILCHPDGSFALHEVYCDEEGRPNGYTERPISFGADADEGPDGIRDALQMALADATNRPVLDAAEIAGPEKDIELRAEADGGMMVILRGDALASLIALSERNAISVETLVDRVLRDAFTKGEA